MDGYIPTPSAAGRKKGIQKEIFMVRRVLPSPNATDRSEQPWSGLQPEEAVMHLISYLRCASAGPDDTACVRWLLSVAPTGRFRQPPHPLGDAERALFAEVLAVLCNDGGDRVAEISTQRLERFYAAAIPDGVALPFVVRVDNEPRSWFVPVAGRPNTWVSCLHFSQVLRDGVLARDALVPATANRPWEYPEFARLPGMVRIMEFFRTKVRPDGLRSRERDDFLEATLRILEAPAPRPRTAAEYARDGVGKQ